MKRLCCLLMLSFSLAHGCRKDFLLEIEKPPGEDRVYTRVISLAKEVAKRAALKAELLLELKKQS
jgi:hypothetical protein